MQQSMKSTDPEQESMNPRFSFWNLQAMKIIGFAIPYYMSFRLQYFGLSESL